MGSMMGYPGQLASQPTDLRELDPSFADAVMEPRKFLGVFVESARSIRDDRLSYKFAGCGFAIAPLRVGLDATAHKFPGNPLLGTSQFQLLQASLPNRLKISQRHVGTAKIRRFGT